MISWSDFFFSFLFLGEGMLRKLLWGSKKVVLKLHAKHFPLYQPIILIPSVSPTAKLYRWRSYDSETQVCNRTQILSFSFSKLISNVNPDFSRLTFLQCHFFFNFYHIWGTQVPSTQDTEILKFSRNSQYGQFYPWKVVLRPHLMTLKLLVKNSDSVGGGRAVESERLWQAGKGTCLSVEPLRGTPTWIEFIVT